MGKSCSQFGPFNKFQTPIIGLLDTRVWSFKESSLKLTVLRCDTPLPLPLHCSKPLGSPSRMPWERDGGLRNTGESWNVATLVNLSLRWSRNKFTPRDTGVHPGYHIPWVDRSFFSLWVHKCTELRES